MALQELTTYKEELQHRAELTSVRNALERAKQDHENFQQHHNTTVQNLNDRLKVSFRQTATFKPNAHTLLLPSP